MNSKEFPLVVLLGTCGVFWGFTGWMLPEFPPDLLFPWIIGGVVLFAMVLMRILSRHEEKSRVDDTTPEDRPRLELPPGTRAERKADLRAMSESRMLIEDYIDRWSEREIIEAPTPGCTGMFHKDGKQCNLFECLQAAAGPAPEVSKFKEGQWVRLQQREGWVSTEWSGKPALVIGQAHEPRLWSVRVSGYVVLTVHEDCMTAEPDKQYVAYTEKDGVFGVRFKEGQWVRVKPGGRHGGNLVKLWEVCKVVGENIWTFSYSTDHADSLFEQCFEPAVPKKGEWWKKLECANTHGGNWHSIQLQWEIEPDKKPSDYVHAAAAIECGCFVPANYGIGFPRTGVEYVSGPDVSKYKGGDRIRVTNAGYLNDRLGVLARVHEFRSGGNHLWETQRDGGPVTGERLYETQFVLAVPIKGEVWMLKECNKCFQHRASGWPQPGKPFDVESDWAYSPMVADWIRCGCLYRIGIQDAKK